MTKEKFERIKAYYASMVGIAFTDSSMRVDDVAELIKALEQAWAKHNAFIIQAVKNDLSLTEEMEGLRRERDALQVQLVEERGRHREFERELLTRAALAAQETKP